MLQTLFQLDIDIVKYIRLEKNFQWTMFVCYNTLLIEIFILFLMEILKYYKFPSFYILKRIYETDSKCFLTLSVSV